MFFSFVRSSLVTGIVIMALLALMKRIGKRYAVKLRYWIWLVLALRLLFPVSITLPQRASGLPLVRQVAAVTDRFSPVDGTRKAAIQPDQSETEPEPLLPASQGALSTISQESQAAVPAAVQPENTKRKFDIALVLQVIWLVGAAGFFGYYLLANVTFRRKVLRWGRPTQNPTLLLQLEQAQQDANVRQSLRLLILPEVPSPMVIGLIRPILILPQEDWDTTELRYVLRHEMIHVRRRDILYKLVLLLANAVHWFNPAAWLLRSRASQDLEISCDTLVMEGATDEVRRRYCEMLLSTAQRSAMYGLGMTTTLGSSKKSILERFREIFNSGRRKKGIPILLFVIVLAMLCGGVVIQTEEQGTEPAVPVSDDGTVNGQALASSMFSVFVPETALDYITVSDEYPLVTCRVDGQKLWSIGTINVEEYLERYPGSSEIKWDSGPQMGQDYLIGQTRGLLFYLQIWNTDILLPESQAIIEDLIDRNGLVANPVCNAAPVYVADGAGEDTVSQEENLSERDLFYEIFPELDQSSMEAYLTDHPESLQEGWSGININEAGLDDVGTSIRTIYGDQVLALNAAQGVVLVRVELSNSRGVLAIGKDSSRLSLCAASTLGEVGQTVGQICAENGGILAMTGSAFLDDGSSNGGLLSGTAVCSGEVLTGKESLDDAGDKRVELRSDNRMYITDTTDPIGADVRDAAEFHPALIVDGKILVDESCGWTSPNPRAVIGQSDKLETMMLVVEGRLLDSPGCGVVEIAERLSQYGCMQALNLDGGTSAMLYYDGEYVTRCSNTQLPAGRTLPTAWVYH